MQVGQPVCEAELGPRLEDTMKSKMSWRAISALMLTCTFSLVACASQTTDESGAEQEASGQSTEDALMGTANVKLLYEGTCAFLHNCSVWSRRLPEPQVQWGCGGTMCSDSEKWMAGPSKSYCGKSVRVCKDGTCATGVVRDVSNKHGWEASSGLMDALGIGYTVDVNACKGTGGGSATVQVL